MSLPDHYQILEVPATATSAEIKAAYRRLAKIFHPDKNGGSPAAEEKFKQVKEAYETLINPLRRRKYDEKRNRSLSTPASSLQKKQTVRKNYDFSEEEAKRRKYYEQHYGKKNTRKQPVPEKEKPISKELKYILVSVPLAVALLLLIIRLYERPRHVIKNEVQEEENALRVRTPDSPYEAQVGKNFYDTSGHSVITVQNRCGNDAIVFLKNDTGRVMRHHFIENNYEVMMENLPKGNYHLYYWVGKNFSNRYYLFGDIIGNFERAFCTDSMKDNIALKANEVDTFLYEIHNNFGCRSDSAFLKKIFRKS